MRTPARQRDFLPNVAAGASAAIWGAFWIPLRLLEDGGLGGPWTVLTIYVVQTIILLPIVLARWSAIRASGSSWILTGLFAGGSFCLYANAFLSTEIVRVLLLFYLMPVWATLLGRVFLNESITAVRLLAIALGLCGLFVMLGIDKGWPMPRNAGDWMALAAGVIWAYACVRLRRTVSVGTIEQSFGFSLWGVVWGVAFLFIPIKGGLSVPAPGAFEIDMWFILGGTAAFVIVTNLIIIWAARLLSPGRVGLLLMTELIAGAATAAWLTGEPFGWREIVGGALIIAAALIDIFLQRDPVPEEATAG